MLHDTGLPKTSQKYKNFRDYPFPVYHSEKARIPARSNPHQPREDPSASAGRTFGNFLLSLVCDRILLLGFQIKRPFSSLQIDFLRAGSLRYGRRFKLSRLPKSLEFLEIYFGLILFGRTFPPSTPNLLFVPRKRISVQVGAQIRDEKK